MPENNWNLILDFDSTIIKSESLDLLSGIVLDKDKDKVAKLQKIKRLTEQGMNGIIPFQDSLDQRLQSIAITKEDIQLLNEILVDLITPSFIQNRKWLMENSDRVYIFSGGFKETILPVAEIFKIKSNHVFANTFIYSEIGEITGICKKNPFSRSGGKVEKARELNFNGEIIMVGDGNTDAEMKNLNQNVNFIAFTENIYRDSVVKKADVVAESFNDVINFIQHE